MNKAILCIALIFGAYMYADGIQDKTEALHAEAMDHKNPILTEKTHPVFCAMVKNLTTLAHIDMPRYISTYDAEGTVVTRNGTVHKATNTIDAWIDVPGDLYICHEILTNLSYEQVEAVVAVAIAEKAHNRPGKLAAVGCATFIATAAVICMLNKAYELRLGEFLFDNHCSHQTGDNIEALLWIVMLPTSLITKIVSNNMQKSIDLNAAHMTDTTSIIEGITSLTALKDTYVKEGYLSRLASALRLKAIYNALFYPVRSFTNEERIAYLDDHKMNAKEIQ